MALNAQEQITDIKQLTAGEVFEISGSFYKEPVLVRSLGNYGVGDKVYLTPIESNETPSSMAKKFQDNIRPNCFVCWDYQIGTTYGFVAATHQG